MEDTVAPAMVFQEADLSVRVVRDIFSADFERALVDDPKQHHRLVSFFTRTAPELVDRVELYEGQKTPLFEAYGVEKVIDGLMGRRVDLPSGGYLMIDYAEALTVIDVNSGSFVGRGKQARLEDTILKTNLEAAEAVVNELRLRDIGGIIVIDFIDMARARNRDAVLKTLRTSLEEDRTKTFTAEISKLGLVEMTRQNVTEGVREIISRPCPTCDGDGVIRSEETIAIEFERRHARHRARSGQGRRGVPRADEPARERAVHRQRRARAARAGGETGRTFHFEGSEGLPLDHFAVTMEGKREEVEERAVPFREGDEVLVHIVEPHMYDVDDAVAKIDGYIVSVAGAGPLVGEKRLVRIEQAGRTSATAVARRPRPGPPGSPGRAPTAMTGRPRPGAAGAGAAGGGHGPRRTPGLRRSPSWLAVASLRPGQLGESLQDVTAPRPDHPLGDQPAPVDLDQDVLVPRDEMDVRGSGPVQGGDHDEGSSGAPLGVPIEEQLPDPVLAPREGVVLVHELEEPPRAGPVRAVVGPVHGVDDPCVVREEGQERVHPPPVRAPRVRREQVVDRDAVLQRQRAGAHATGPKSGKPSSTSPAHRSTIRSS